MTNHLVGKVLSAFVVFILITCNNTPAQTNSDELVTKIGHGFTSQYAEVNGTTLHYVRGGSGPPIILLHGFPQDWFAFHKIMPQLAKNFTVIAIDSRGIGRSQAIPEGYDILNLTEDLYQLVQLLKLEQVYIAGHDNGAMVAYTFVRLYPNITRGVMILDCPIPGIDPWEEVKADPSVWHFAFHQTPNLPEQLISCQKFFYFRDFFDRLAFNKNAISDKDVNHYVNSYASAEQLRAGLEFYRQAYPSSEKFNATQRSKINVPIVLATGDESLAQLAPKIAQSLRKHGCANVTVEIIKNSGHWVMDEQPDIVIALFKRYATRE